MDGNTRYELTSASPDSNFAGSYESGQRGYSAPSLGRSSSFREVLETKNTGSAKVNSRVSSTSSGDGATLSQCLMLEPIAISDSKYARPGELRRVLSFSVASNSEENPSGAIHSKHSPPVAFDELKRLRANFADNYSKASGRAKKLDEHLNKLNKYVEAMPSKKQQKRNELLTNERSSGSLLKIGSQMHRNPLEAGNQKFDDRPKNGGLNKRLRTSMAETRAECRNNGVLRQPAMMAKDRDTTIKDNNTDSDLVEEKIRRLPAGGEGWDKKMRRKRSVGTVFSRSVDSDGELKRNMHHKLNVESGLHSNDSTTHGFRSGTSSGSNKVDPMPSPTSSSARITLKNEEKSMLSRDVSGGPIKDRASGKVNLKLNNHEDNHSICSSPIVKGKASRAPRGGSMAASNPKTNGRFPGTLESWEQPEIVNKTASVTAANNRKRAMPAGSSSSPVTQWGGQRPQKISRTRRTKLIPVSNHDEVQGQPEPCSSPDFGPRIGIGGMNSSLLPKSAANGNLNLKNAPSPSRLSESEEYGAGENRINVKEKTAIPLKKNKFTVKDESNDGVRRQGRSGRVSPFSRASVSPMRENLDNVGPTKPPRNARSGGDKNGSKSSRPLKKLSDRKGFSRLGHVANGGSPDCNGELDDDREELLTAANHACSSSFNACSNAFWKTFEALFASVGTDEKSFLLEQLKSTEESCASLLQNSSSGNLIQEKMDDQHHEELTATDSVSCGRNRCTKTDSEFKDSVDRMEFVAQLKNATICGSQDAEKRFEIATPLYQRVLSAMIMEEEIEEYEETGFGRQRSSVDDSSGQDYLCNGDLVQKKSGYEHSDVDELVRLSGCDCMSESLPSFDFPYEQQGLEGKLLLELQSIGLFLESVPALNDKEEEVVGHEIDQLQKKLRDRVVKKKTCLDKIYKVVQEENDTARADPEQCAMDKLVELAFKKLLAMRGSFAAKHGIPKVSKQVALAFVKRTLVRCIKFEESGASCFSDTALQEIIFTPPPRFPESELLSGINDGGSIKHQSGPSVTGNGPLSIREKKKKVLLDDVVGSAVFRASSALGVLNGAKGKRSERDKDRDDSSKNDSARIPMGVPKGDRKTKSKPKPKTAQLNDFQFISSGNVASISSQGKESTDFGLEEELGVDSEIGAPQDLTSWFNFDEVDGLQDHDSIGLEIPMDDLSELNMF